MEEKELNGLKYIVKYPKNFDKNKKYPMILFLHGVGSCGDTFEKLEKNPYFLNADTDRFISYAPLCNAVSWFDLFEHLKALLEFAANEKCVDAKRIYGMGASMGGYGTWQLGMSLPDTFAAIVPICGGGMYWNAERLKNTPVWAFHGAKDPAVKCEESIKMTDAVKRHGGDARLTVYPENEHDAWSDTYKNYEVFEWLLSHEKGGAAEYADEYVGSKNFG